MNTRLIRYGLIISLLASVAPVVPAGAAENPFLGSWQLTLPDGSAGWLGVKETDGKLSASMMWSAGSVEPTASAKMEGDQLVITRMRTVERTVPGTGKKARTNLMETLNGTVNGDTLQVSGARQNDDGGSIRKIEFSGKRTPPMPPAPNLSNVKYGEELRLFNGKNLDGWRLTNPSAANGWSAKDGLLVNEAVQEEGKPHKNFGNLRTDREFEDFNLKLEVKVPEKGNSGVYIRGMYEVQVEDSYGKAPESHIMGAIYSRIKPEVNATKPHGEWQTMDITFVDRHATVFVNGKRTIDNQPVEGCTGGALWSDVTRPGPIYLQGDHTSIEYRNIVIRPVVKQ
jgi:hypothetical protein